MQKTLFLIVMFFVSSLSAFAQKAASSWVCSYNGFGPDNKVVIVDFLIDRDYLIGSFGQRFKILENNEVGLVAAWSIATIEENRNDPSLGAMIISINKKTGEFRRSNALFSSQDSAVRYGRCVLK